MRQEYTVKAEKIQEDINLIQNHYKNRVREISAMEGKISSLLQLKNISDELSFSFSEEDVIRVAVDRTFETFKDDSRVMLFLVAEKRYGLELVCTAMGEKAKPVIMKKGGTFERWVIKNMQSLLVKDARKDFRFSLNPDEDNEEYIAIISKPFISDGNIIGVLKVDSKKEGVFEQHELRMLDIIGEIATVAIKNARLYRKTEELAIRDSLTGLYVYRYFMDRLEAEVKRAIRSNVPFAVFMIDIDNFKGFNDKHGHVAGDLVLKNVGSILNKKYSAGDIACRYGGEEFAFVALNYNKTQAVKLAEEIREDIARAPIEVRREKITVTVSIGVAVFGVDAKFREDLLMEADKCLYRAKAEGKNRVVCAD
ncbi:sensor histidine kinase [Candidatus Omnitrophus magneticus]|uniref:diguanylate cyclase n=1 Tax=Candidatus Omnitrophus magneticus TaxID=1609969 RepID=A0A0F0CU81_9BACT|nr:sensor histidine kinase [Candidatus Omnitrophus magneticus]